MEFVLLSSSGATFSRNDLRVDREGDGLGPQLDGWDRQPGDELDGSLVLRLRIAETSELRRWILQFGSQVEVLAPASLRRAVVGELKTAVTAYRNNPAQR
jgi:predicted DNA-binding transcriptional regulator YafY